eukprot:766378-Hanusia_phi.AAC.5
MGKTGKHWSLGEDAGGAEPIEDARTRGQRVERQAKVRAEVRMVAQMVLPGKRRRIGEIERSASMTAGCVESCSPVPAVAEAAREEEEGAVSQPCKPEEVGVARWVGESLGREGGKEMYKSFAKNGDVLSVSDCVYVKPEEKDQAAVSEHDPNASELRAVPDANPTAVGGGRADETAGPMAVPTARHQARQLMQPTCSGGEDRE